jgi:hypothetical protein
VFRFLLGIGEAGNSTKTLMRRPVNGQGCLSLEGQFRTLFEFDNWKYGTPTDLIEASDGDLYGVAQGQVNLGGVNSLFRISLAGKFENVRGLTCGSIHRHTCWS